MQLLVRFVSCTFATLAICFYKKKKLSYKINHIICMEQILRQYHLRNSCHPLSLFSPTGDRLFPCSPQPTFPSVHLVKYGTIVLGLHLLLNILVSIPDLKILHAQSLSDFPSSESTEYCSDNPCLSLCH